MSFPSELLDGYEIVRKRTTATMDATHAMGSFIKGWSVVLRDFQRDAGDLVARAKKEHVPKCDFSVLTGFETMVNEVEKMVACQINFAEQLMEQRKEIDEYLKAKEKRQKQLIKDGENLEKVWENQLDALKKARTNYVKLGKEAQSMAENLEKKKQDPKTKPDVVSQLSSKTQQAAEKRDQADDAYKQVLEQTNAKMEQYYSVEQPALLTEYQKFEEERIEFMKTNMTRFVEKLRETQSASIFDQSCSTMENAFRAIDIDSDISQWAVNTGTHTNIPDPINYCTYDIEGGFTPIINNGPGGRRPGGGESRSSSTRAPAQTPTATASTSSSSSSHSKKSSSKKKSSSSKFDISKYQVKDADSKKAAKLLKSCEDDLAKERKDLAASEKLLSMYSKDPEGAKEVEENIAETNSHIKQLEECKRNLEELAGGSGGDGGNGGHGANAEHGEGEPGTAMFDYTAANETEMSFKEGDTLMVLEKDDSGWWFAAMGAAQGFVPANYVKLEKK